MFHFTNINSYMLATTLKKYFTGILLDFWSHVYHRHIVVMFDAQYLFPEYYRKNRCKTWNLITLVYFWKHLFCATVHNDCLSTQIWQNALFLTLFEKRSLLLLFLVFSFSINCDIYYIILLLFSSRWQILYGI